MGGVGRWGRAAAPGLPEDARLVDWESESGGLRLQGWHTGLCTAHAEECEAWNTSPFNRRLDCDGRRPTAQPTIGGAAGGRVQSNCLLVRILTEHGCDSPFSLYAHGAATRQMFARARCLRMHALASAQAALFQIIPVSFVLDVSKQFLQRNKVKRK